VHNVSTGWIGSVHVTVFIVYAQSTRDSTAVQLLYMLLQISNLNDPINFVFLCACVFCMAYFQRRVSLVGK